MQYHKRIILSIFKTAAKMKRESRLEYTTEFINRNFRIKVYGRDENGKKINTLVKNCLTSSSQEH